MKLWAKCGHRAPDGPSATSRNLLYQRKPPGRPSTAVHDKDLRRAEHRPAPGDLLEGLGEAQRDLAQFREAEVVVVKHDRMRHAHRVTRTVALSGASDSLRE